MMHGLLSSIFYFLLMFTQIQNIKNIHMLSNLVNQSQVEMRQFIILVLFIYKDIRYAQEQINQEFLSQSTKIYPNQLLANSAVEKPLNGVTLTNQKKVWKFISSQHYLLIQKLQMINRSAQIAQTEGYNLGQASKQSKWQKIINAIVRPPRSNYKQSMLGSKTFILNERIYQRKEVQINHQENMLQLMSFEPQFKSQWIILYLHGNSASKIQATTIIKYIPLKLSLASFDFIGCGHNTQSETISLGVREAQQVQTVVNYLNLHNWKVILWGRSMGAASALKYGKAPIIVADSSFSCFKSLCLQKAKQNSPQYVPNCLISCVFPCVYQKLRSDIQQIAKYDIDQLDILKDVSRISKQTMIIFMNGNQDILIDKENSEKLYNAFKGNKKYLQIFNGTHNTKRPQETLKKAMRYIAHYIDEQQTTNKGSVFNQISSK